jgi:hypothetical protein
MSRDNTAGSANCTANFTATTTWQRVSCSPDAITTTNTNALRIYPGGSGGTGTIIAWGAQFDSSTAGQRITSYIPTTTAVATRSGDGLTYAATWLSGILASASVSMDYAPMNALGALRGWLLATNAGTGCRSMEFVDTGSNYRNNVTFVGACGAADAVDGSASSWVADQSYRLRMTRAGRSVEFWRDGVPKGSGTHSALPSDNADQITIGLEASGTAAAKGHIADLCLGRGLDACQ